MSQSASNQDKVMGTSNVSPPQLQPPDPKKWIGLIAAGLVLGEAIWLFVAALTRDVIVPAMAMAMGGDTSSPLSLGRQDFNVPELFTAVLQLCLAGIVAILLNAWIQRKPRIKAGKGKSLRLTQTVAQPEPRFAQPAPGVAKTPASAPPPSSATMEAVTEEIRVPGKPVAAQVPATASAPVAAFRTKALSSTEVAPAASQPAPTSSWTPPAPASGSPQPAASVQPQAVVVKPAPPATKPAKPKKPKEVYYNIVGERITPDDDDTSDQ
jgi:hypothetical protein